NKNRSDDGTCGEQRDYKPPTKQEQMCHKYGSVLPTFQLFNYTNSEINVGEGMH
ncbi:hypothetical protein J6590_077112, partial [Homalodisca vitripennis]